MKSTVLMVGNNRYYAKEGGTDGQNKFIAPPFRPQGRGEERERERERERELASKLDANYAHSFPPALDCMKRAAAPIPRGAGGGEGEAGH